MPTWLIVLLAVLAALVLIFGIGGAVYVSRRNRREKARFDVVVAEANRGLAAAHALDKGWEPEALHAAARSLYSAERPGIQVRELMLVAVRDEPGTDSDQAVFRITTDGAPGMIWLGRRDGTWVADEVT